MNDSANILDKVAFIDDSTEINQVHLMLARSMNLAREVQVFETAEDALRKYSNPESTQLPDIFFVDIGLPRMSGHELSVELRALPGYDSTKTAICFLTASKDIRDVVMADNNEFDHYYWKPLDKRKVVQVLRDVFDIEL